MPSTCGPNKAPGRKHNLPMGLTKLLVETQLTCGPNEAPGRNRDVWSFTCEPNEAPGRNQIGLLLVGLTKLLVETKL